MPSVHTLTHPILQQRLSVLRQKDTTYPHFRQCLHEIGTLMAYEVTRDLQTQTIEIQTPLAKAEGVALARPLVLVPILRAGIGLLNGMLSIFHEARVGHIGLYRDEKTLQPHHYYLKLPEQTPQADVLLIDPMLATGESASQAAAELKKEGAQNIRFLNLVSCQTGIDCFHKTHPDIPIYTCAIDPILNENAYIVPGLGDAGDRYFGTQ